MKRRNNMYMALIKEKNIRKNACYDLKTNDDIQLIISQQITSQLSKDMKEMSQVLTRSILEGMSIDYRK